MSFGKKESLVETTFWIKRDWEIQEGAIEDVPGGLILSFDSNTTTHIAAGSIYGTFQLWALPLSSRMGWR